MPELIIPNCSHCGSKLVKRRTRNNREIYACPNWRFDGINSCQGDIYDPNREAEHKSRYPRVVIRWNVPSRSEPGKYRTVEIYEDGSMRCNCPAWKEYCYHQQVAVRELEDLLAKIIKGRMNLSDQIKIC